MSDIDLEAMAVAFWIRDNDRMLISAGAIAEIDKAVQAAHAAGVAAEKARCVAVIEAKQKRIMGTATIEDLFIQVAVVGALDDVLAKVRQ